MDTTDYEKYIARRLADPSVISDAQRVAASIAATRGVGRFALVVTADSQLAVYECEAVGSDGSSPRLLISAVHIYGHTLAQACADAAMVQQSDASHFRDADGQIAYDEMYDELCPELAEFHQSVAAATSSVSYPSATPCYVSGPYATLATLLHAIQQATGHPVLPAPERTASAEPYVPETTAKMPAPVHGTVGQMLGRAVSVVDVPASDTAFMAQTALGTASWGSLLPNADTGSCDYMIGSIPMRRVSLALKADAFGNLFCTAATMHGECRTTLVHHHLTPINHI